MDKSKVAYRYCWSVVDILFWLQSLGLREKSRMQTKRNSNIE